MTITALQHRGIFGALTTDGAECWVAVRHFGKLIQSEPSECDLLEPDSVVQKNWNAAVDAYLEGK